jgi:hypothetical protein
MKSMGFFVWQPGASAAGVPGGMLQAQEASIAGD